MKFLRIDKDETVDTQSYYDDRGWGQEENWQSSWPTRDSAIDNLVHTYGDRHKQYIEEHVIKTEIGWGLPAGEGFLFGQCVDPTRPEGWNTLSILAYYKAGRYLQVWEGTWIDEYSRLRRDSVWDGDLFIPIRLLRSWKIPPLRTYEPEDANWDEWEAWKKTDLSIPPWEWAKTQKSASLQEFLLADFQSTGYQIVPETCPAVKYLLELITDYAGVSSYYVIKIANDKKWGDLCERWSLDPKHTAGFTIGVDQQIGIKDLRGNQEYYSLLHELCHATLNQFNINDEGIVDAMARDIQRKNKGIPSADFTYFEEANQAKKAIKQYTGLSMQEFIRQVVGGVISPSKISAIEKVRKFQR